MDLISRLESAPEGSRELSDEVLLAAVKGWQYAGGGWTWHGRLMLDRPDPTRNVQDAIDWLVPEGWSTDIHTADESMETFPVGYSLLVNDECSSVEIFYIPTWNIDNPVIAEAYAATPPLAMSAACLKAMEIEK